MNNPLKCCINCGKEFDRPLRSKKSPIKFKVSWSQYRKMKLCSPKCRYAVQSLKVRGPNNYAWRGGKNRFKCLDCGVNITNFRKRCRHCNSKFRVGPNNALWGRVAEKITYKALHIWVRRHLGHPTKCSKCGLESSNHRQIQWANKSHKYFRNASDWIALCVSCHRKHDGMGGKRLCKNKKQISISKIKEPIFGAFI